MRKTLLSLLLCCTILAAPALAQTNNTPPTAEAAGAAPTPGINAALTSPVTAVGTEDTVALTLDIDLPGEWHTYWRSPGVAGLPPSVTWETQTNVSDITFHWPRPIRFSQQGLETFGYRDRLTIPLTAKLVEAGKPISLKGKLDTIICTEICVPASAMIELELPAGASAPSRDVVTWENAMRTLPLTANQADVTLASLLRDGETLKVGVLHKDNTKITDVIVETPGYLAFKAITAAPMDGGTTLTVPFDNASEAPQVDGQELTLTFLGTIGQAPQAIETKAAVGYTMQNPGATIASDEKADTVAAVAGDVTGEPAPKGLLLILGLAILGGLILNLMPCVLPVLSLKMFSLINHAGESKVRIRRGFIATSLGILLSFWVLAAVTIALKETGMALGWGIQFQQPLFLAFLTVVVTFFTANMWGFFEIGLPRLLHNKFAGPVPGDSNLMAEFLTGVFATLLATPCTAPFVGTAVGFALSQSALHIALIFSALGIGLALPYLLVAAFPAIAHHLPKPGNWMRWLRVVLGVALLATALWLVWVMWMQTSTAVAIAALALIILLLWALYKQQMITAIVLGFLLVTAPLGLPRTAPAEAPTAIETDSASWNTLNADGIPMLVTAGKTVFVDITASWCITCHANKKLVLDVEPVASALREGHVILMRGDWTRPDPVISAYLKKYGRYGIPFNIVFGPGAPDGILLPELLTPSIVTDALTKASEAKTDDAN